MSESTAPPEQPVRHLLPTHAASPPTNTPIIGKYVTLERLSHTHAPALYTAIGAPAHATLWTYIPFGPFPTPAAFSTEIDRLAMHPTDHFYAIIPHSAGEAAGIFALINFKPEHRAVELGFVVFGPEGLQRSRAATEAFYLVARHAFEDCGCRRFVWKCDALNAPSRRAAARLGFRAEGVHRQDLIVKGRNRDTAWFSVVDGEWGGVKGGFKRWLEEGNFGEGGRQRVGLVECRGSD